MDKPNQDILLAETQVDFVIDGQTVCVPARVVERFFPEPRVVIEVSDVPRRGGSGLLTSEGPSAITLENGTEIAVVPCPWFIMQRGADLPVGKYPCVALQTGRLLAKLQFNIINLRWYAGARKIALQDDEWRLSIEPSETFSKTTDALDRSGGYGVTHTGTIERTDKGTFSVKTAEDMLQKTRLFLSFICGAHCSTTNVTGFDDNDSEAWRRWGTNGVSPWKGRRSWLDITVLGALPIIFPAFFREVGRYPSLARAIVLYAESNVSSTIDVSLILAQVVLEIFVSLKGSTGKNPGERIANVLANAGIPREIPSELKNLKALSAQNKWTNGPHAVVGLRNSITHPRAGHHEGSMDAYYEAKKLTLWYVELLLLEQFKYQGEYASRLTEVQRAGQTELVPWASPKE